MENKIFAVKRQNGKLWAAIDCGTTQKGGMSTGNYWQTHFEKDGKTYRWYSELFMPPSDLQEWSEIKVTDKSITVIADNGDLFEGWEDRENEAYETLQKFAKLLGKNLTVDEVRMLINGEDEQLNKPAVSIALPSDIQLAILCTVADAYLYEGLYEDLHIGGKGITRVIEEWEAMKKRQ